MPCCMNLISLTTDHDVNNIYYSNLHTSYYFNWLVREYMLLEGESYNVLNVVYCSSLSLYRDNFRDKDIFIFILVTCII